MANTVTRSRQYGSFNQESTSFMNADNPDHRTLGVRVAQPGRKKALKLDLALPSKSPRSGEGVTKIRLNGWQARRVFETLAEHYASMEEAESRYEIQARCSIAI